MRNDGILEALEKEGKPYCGLDMESWVILCYPNQQETHEKGCEMLPVCKAISDIPSEGAGDSARLENRGKACKNAATTAIDFLGYRFSPKETDQQAEGNQTQKRKREGEKEKSRDTDTDKRNLC